MQSNFKFLFVLMVSIYSLNAKGQCTDPTNLIYSYTNNESTFSWDAVPGALSYEIEFKNPGSFYTWDYPEYVTTSNTNSLSLVNIQASASYEYRVRAVCTSTTFSNFTLSQFTVPCVTPTNLTLVSATTNSAQLSWTDETGILEPSSYSVSYRVLNSGSAWTPVGNGYFNTITLNNLLPGTTYEWCVNRTCGYFWSDPAFGQFSTISVAPCVSPSNLSASNITTNSVLLTWDAVAGATGYVLQYSFNNTWVSANVSGTSFSLTGLNNNTQYVFRVQTLCAGNSQSALSSNYAFTTSNTFACNNATVTNLQVVSAANNGVLVSWDAVSAVTGYVVEYKLASASSWTVISPVYLNSFTTNSLALGSTYNFRVKAFCTNNSTPYTSANFTTASAPAPQTCNSSGVNTLEFIDLFKLGSINRVSGAEPGGYVNTGLTTDLAIGRTHSAQFSAGFTAASRAQNYAVYIDFNRNGNFNEPGERVFGVGLASNGGVRNFNITIPATATAGPAALRVVMMKTGTNVSPCANSFFGEVEDYTVNLVTVSNKKEEDDIQPEEETANITTNPSIFFNVYPNPSSNLFFVSGSENSASVRFEVFALDGRLLLSGDNLNQSSFTIDLTNYNNGIYLLNLVDENNVKSTHKLLKQ